MSKILKLLLCFSLVITASYGEIDSTAVDSTALDSLPFYRLGEILVIAKKPENQIVPIDRIDAIEIKRKTASTAADALKILGGLDITVDTKGEAALMLQGFQPTQVAVLIDGRPVNNPYYGKTDLEAIPTDDIARINIVKSAISPITAVNAMGGFVSITTEAPIETDYTKLGMSYGSGNTLEGKFKIGRIYELPNFDQIFYSFGIYLARSDGFPLPDTFKTIGFDDGGLRDNSDYRKTNIHAKIGYRSVGKLEVGLSLGYYVSERGIPPKEKMDARFWRFPTWRRSYADLSFDYRPSVKINLLGKLYFDQFYNELISYQDRSYDPERIWWDSVHDMKDFGGVLEMRLHPTERSETHVGLQYRVDLLNRHPDVDAEWLRNHLWTGNFALAHSVDLGRWKLLASLAVPFFANDSTESYQKLVNPQFAVSLNALKWMTLWTSVAKTSRFPTGHELYSMRSGNPNLRPEHAIRFQFGGDIRPTDWLSAKASVFYNSLKDLIERPARDSLYRNVESAYTAGSELEVSATPIHGLSLRVSYTNTIGENLTTGEILPGIVNHKISLTLDFAPSNDRLFRLTYLYESQRFWPEKTLDPYFVIDIYTEQQISSNFTFFVSIKNLLDRLYEEEPYLPMPGRRVTIGVEGRM